MPKHIQVQIWLTECRNIYSQLGVTPLKVQAVFDGYWSCFVVLLFITQRYDSPQDYSMSNWIHTFSNQSFI